MRNRISHALITCVSILTLDAVCARKFSLKRFSSESSFFRKFKPELLGRYHNEAFKVLGDMYQDQNQDMNKLDLVDSVASVISSFCLKGDKGCEAQAYQVTVEAFYDSATSRTSATVADLPPDFDENIAELISTAQETVKVLDTTETSTVLKVLYGIIGETMAIETPNKMDKIIGIGVVSVAIGSTQLWSSVGSDVQKRSFLEKTANLSQCYSDEKWRGLRNLQTDLPVNLSGAVEADVNGALKGAIDFVSEHLGAFEIVELLNITALTTKMLQTAIAASLSALFDLSE